MQIMEMKSNILKYAINDIATILKKEYKPQKIILFGSCVRGHITKNSDIDMLIIKDTKKSPTKRWIEVRSLTRNLKRHIPFSPLVYTSNEIVKRLKLGDFFIQEILKHGKILYEK